MWEFTLFIYKSMIHSDGDEYDSVFQKFLDE